MENPNFLEQPQPSGFKKFHGTLILTVAIAAVVGYLVLANQMGLWPFPEPIMIINPTPTPTPTTAENGYINDQYGFSIPLPDSWRGYTVINSQWEGRDVSTGRITERGPLITLRDPKWKETDQREDMPIMVFTLSQWALVQEENLSLGAAPIPPSVLGKNSQYVIALPARYNYDYKTNWEEVDLLVHAIRVFEPGTGATSSAVPDGWKSFRFDKYGFEFRYPGAVTFTEGHNPGALEEVIFSNGSYLFVASAESILQGKEDCSGQGEDCVPYEPLDNCLYPCYKDESTPWASNRRVNFRDTASGLIIEFAMDGGKVEFNLFDKILQTFRFIK